jgi:cytoskeletal protein CcmA (bactofilin family)
VEEKYMKSLYHRQILFLIIFFLALLLIIAAIIYGSSANAEEYSSIKGAAKKDINQYEGEHLILENEVVRTDIIMIEGKLTIEGSVYGDIITKKCEVKLTKTAMIYGNVYCFNGEVTKDDSTHIAGDIVSIGSNGKNYLEYIKCRNITSYSFPYRLFTITDFSEQEETKTIASDQTISGDIICVNKTLIIKGKVDGDVIGFKSDTQLLETGAIDGHVINIDGKLEVASQSLITGKVFDNTPQQPVAQVIEKEDEKKVEEEDNDDQEIPSPIKEKYLHPKTKKSDTVRFFGDVTINTDEVIEGSVVVMKGTATIQGEVHGDVVSVFGDIDMDSTAQVTGDVVSVGGKIFRAKGASVGGDVVQTSWTGVKVDNNGEHVEAGLNGVKVGSKKEEEWKHKKTPRWGDSNFDSNDFLARYNRVEGLLLGFQKARHYWDEPRTKDLNVALYGHFGYAFQNKNVSYQLGLERWIFNASRFTIGGELHDMTDTQDEWIISSFENSLSAFFIRQDFQDFYRRVGASGYVMQNITPNFRALVGYRKERFYSMDKETDWSLFHPVKKFRPNPAVDEIKMKSIFASVGLDTRNDVKNPTQGWFINLEGEFARPDLNNDLVDFDRYILDVRRFQPLSFGESFDFRVRLGSSRGQLPVQYLYDLGGISTLRAYKFKEYQNKNRLLIINAEYRIFDDIGAGLFNDINLIIFADAGSIWDAKETNTAFDDSFRQLTWADLKTDIGLGVGNPQGTVRVDFAKRMDTKDRPTVITFRIRRSF